MMMLHDAVSWSVFLLCLVLIVSPNVPTGIVPTIGLAVIGGAALWSMDDWAPAATVLDALLGGVGLTAGAVLWRSHRRGRDRQAMNRRRSDWLEQERAP